MRAKVRDGVAHAILAGLMLCLLAGLPVTAGAQPDQGELRISLVIPERAVIVAPAIELPREGSPRLCNTRQGNALRKIHYQDSEQPLGRCSPGAMLAEASGRHLVLVTPI